MRKKRTFDSARNGGSRTRCKSPLQVPSEQTTATHAQAEISIKMLTNIASAIARQDQRHEHLVETIKGVEHRLSDRTTALEKTVGHLATKVESLDGTVKVMQGDMKVMRGDITVMQGDMKVMRGDITVMQGDMKVMRSDITVMQGDMKVMQGDMKVMRGDITVMQGDITVMQGDMKVMRGDITVMQSDMKVMRSDITVMQRDIDGMQVDMKVIDGHVTNLMSWKHKVWGMAILGGALVTLIAGAWGLIGQHVRWEAGPAMKSIAPTAAAGVSPALTRLD